MKYKTLKRYMEFCRQNKISPNFHGLHRYRECEEEIRRDSQRKTA